MGTALQYLHENGVIYRDLAGRVDRIESSRFAVTPQLHSRVIYRDLARRVELIDKPIWPEVSS